MRFASLATHRCISLGYLHKKTNTSKAAHIITILYIDSLEPWNTGVEAQNRQLGVRPTTNHFPGTVRCSGQRMKYGTYAASTFPIRRVVAVLDDVGCLSRQLHLKQTTSRKERDNLISIRESLAVGYRLSSALTDADGEPYITLSTGSLAEGTCLASSRASDADFLT